MLWGDDEVSNALPPDVATTDTKGIKTVTSYHTKDGQDYKVTKRVETVKRFVKVNKQVMARREWKKFGDCKGMPKGAEKNVTYESYEQIRMDMKPKTRDDLQEENSLDKLREEKTGSSQSIVVCRHCGETGHWTLKCPKRNTIIVKGEDPVGPGRAGGPTDSTTGAYVPLHKRQGASGNRQATSMTRDDSMTVRVTNLSEDTSEQDLADLFRPFGHTSRIYLAKDRQTQLSRGFAFVTYANRDAGQKAIDALNGHGYDSLILHVEWAKPREDRTDGQNTQAVLASQKRRY